MKIGIDLDDTITDSYDLITDSYFFCCNVDKEKYLKYITTILKKYFPIIKTLQSNRLVKLFLMLK